MRIHSQRVCLARTYWWTAHRGQCAVWQFWCELLTTTTPSAWHCRTYVVGAVRLSQLRATQQPCTRGPATDMDFGSVVPVCHGTASGEFTVGTESTADFGGATRADGRVIPPFNFGGEGWDLGVGYDPGELEPARGFVGEWFLGVRTGRQETYPEAGFAVMLPNHNATMGLRVLADIQEAGFVWHQHKAASLGALLPVLCWLCWCWAIQLGWLVRVREWC